MKLDELKPAEGSRHKKKRVARGWGSGHGKTACRGYNGQGQRSGESAKRGFEGGQMPLFRRLPKKKYFKVINGKTFAVINVRDLNDLEANSTVTYDSLHAQGIIGDELGWGFRVLGDGELKVPLHVQAHHFTAGAKAKIEAAGGTATIVE